MSGQNKYVILKGGNKPTISDIIADCNLGICVETKPGESLTSILRRICSQINRSGPTHIAEGSNITITGSGTAADPYVINSTASGGGGEGLTSVGLDMPVGFIVENDPLTSNGTIQVKTVLNGILRGDGSGFGVIVLGDGLDYDPVTGILSLAETRYVHNQAVATSLWTVTHNLGKKCLVEVFINDKQVFADVEHLSDNSLKIKFTNNQVGYAICKI